MIWIPETWMENPGPRVSLVPVGAPCEHGDVGCGGAYQTQALCGEGLIERGMMT